MLYKKELLENNKYLLEENKRLKKILKEIYEVFITPGNHFEDACDCIQV